MTRMIIVLILILSAFICNELRRFFHAKWIHKNDLFAKLVNNDTDTVNCHIASKIIKDLERSGKLLSSTVEYRDIQSSSSCVYFKIKPREMLVFVFPKVGISEKILNHEIGHGIDITERMQKGKSVYNPLFAKNFILRRWVAAIGIEYESEKRAWGKRTGSSDRYMAASLETYKYQRYACAADLISLSLFFLAFAWFVGVTIG